MRKGTTRRSRRSAAVVRPIQLTANDTLNAACLRNVNKCMGKYFVGRDWFVVILNIKNKKRPSG